MDINKIAAVLTKHPEKGASFPSGTMHPSHASSLKSVKGKGRGA